MKILGTEELTLVVGWKTFFGGLAAVLVAGYWLWSDARGELKEIRAAIEQARIEGGASMAAAADGSDKRLNAIGGRLGQIDANVMNLNGRLASVEQSVKDMDRRVSIVERRLKLASEELKGGFVIVPSSNTDSPEGDKVIPLSQDEIKRFYEDLKSKGGLNWDEKYQQTK